MIGSVIQKGGTFYVYDEKGRILCAKPAGQNDALLGYTSTTFTLKKGYTIYTFNEKGQTVSARPS